MAVFRVALANGDRLVIEAEAIDRFNPEGGMDLVVVVLFGPGNKLFVEFA